MALQSNWKAPEQAAQATAESTQKNIETIVRLEEEVAKQQTRAERVSGAFTRFMGSMTFVVLHLILFTTWCVINLGFTPIEPFDPFPFGILTLFVSAEGVLLAIFVLISQNRMSRQANHRAHLNLQISLLAEQETTKLLQKVESIVDRLGIETDRDKELQQLSQETHLETLAKELQQRLPGE